MNLEEYAKRMAELENKAIGNLNLVDGVDCHICLNKGNIYYASNGEIITKRCECQDKRKAIRYLEESGLKEFVSSKTLDTYIATCEWQANLKTLSREYINQDSNKWFFIGGQVGAGKTHICTAISGELINKCKPTLYMLWSEVSKQLKAKANDSAYSEIIAPYKDVDVLYIDDLLKVKKGEQPTNADINIAFDILNARVMNKDKVTIISSEWTLPELIRIDEGAFSRIKERADKFIFNISPDTNKNYRLRGIRQ